jgi:hypothetical protein
VFTSLMMITHLTREPRGCSDPLDSNGFLPSHVIRNASYRRCEVISERAGAGAKQGSKIKAGTRSKRVSGVACLRL